MSRLLARGALALAISFGFAIGAGANDCFDACWNNELYCLAQNTPSATCLSVYSGCVSTCFLSGGGGIPGGNPPEYAFDFQEVTFATSERWNGRLTNPFHRPGGHATLHLSWTPPDPSKPSLASGPTNGPYNLPLGHRFERNGGEGQNIAVDFGPGFQTEQQNAPLYIWWDYRGQFRWEEIIHFGGHGSPPPPPATITPGQNGGTETFPLWMFASTVDAVFPSLRERRTPELWRDPRVEAAGGRQRAVGRGSRLHFVLRDLMPQTLAGLHPTYTEPDLGVIGGSNAIESIAADYVDASGAIRAVILAFRTRNDVYAHVYSVCGRVKGGWLEDIRFPRTAVPGSTTPATFWQSAMSLPDAGGVLRKEIASGFAVYVPKDGRQLVIDSHWLSEQYPLHPQADGEVLTLQVWATDEATMSAARGAVLEVLARRGELEYRNAAAIPTPELFIAHGDYGAEGASLWTVNNSGAEKTVDFTAITWSAANSQSEKRYQFSRTIRPGRDTIFLEMPGRLNGVVYMVEKGSPWTDMVYVADGNWFSYGDGPPPPFDVPACPQTVTGANDFVVAGCAHLIADVPAGGWRGVGRAMTTYTRNSIDVSSARAISFFAKGSEIPAEIQLVSITDDDRALFHVATFTPSPEGRQITIPFSWIAARDAASGIPFAGRRLVQVTWNFTGGPRTRAELTIGNVYFTSDLVLDSGPMPASTAITTAPYVVVARMKAVVTGAKTTMAWRTRGATAFNRVAMQELEELRYADIPAQQTGTTVESYIEVKDEQGRLATIPPDAPYDTNTFVVSTRPMILVDDFNSLSERNLRGGAAWTFRSPGAALTAERNGSALRLEWNVGTSGSYSGWVSPFGSEVDAAALDSIVLRVRGVTGGERVKIGIGDRAGREHKVLLAKFVEGGLATGWRTARVPLIVFSTIDRHAIARLLLVFENAAGSGAGAIEIDDLTLEASGQPPRLPIENFDDGTTEDALGGNIFTATGSGAILTATHEPSARAGAVGAGYRVVATGGVASWATLGFDLRGVDARALQRLRFWIRGAQGGERLNLYLVSTSPSGAETRQSVELTRYVTLTTSHQRVSIPLSDFAALLVDLGRLTRLEFVWEWNAFADTIEIDEIEMSNE